MRWSRYFSPGGSFDVSNVNWKSMPKLPYATSRNISLTPPILNFQKRHVPEYLTARHEHMPVAGLSQSSAHQLPDSFWSNAEIQATSPQSLFRNLDVFWSAHPTRISRHSLNSHSLSLTLGKALHHAFSLPWCLSGHSLYIILPIYCSIHPFSWMFIWATFLNWAHTLASTHTFV